MFDRSYTNPIPTLLQPVKIRSEYALMRMRLKRALLLAVLTTACRDADPPFLIEPPAWPDSPAIRLTFNPADDRAPVWNRAGDSIYYVAHGYPPFPHRPGIILATSRTGGVAVPVQPAMQLNVAQEPWLAAAAISAQNLALIQVTRLEPYECGVTCPTVTTNIQGIHPKLQSARLRIRPLDAPAGPDAHIIPVVFEGTRHDSTRHPFSVEFVHTHHAHPFQRNFNLFEDAFFRPSWSPDGGRVVFSDGLDLYIWQVGAVQPTKIAGTADGVWPAWSPDGQSIAYTRLPRSLPQLITCFCTDDKGNVVAVYETTFHDDTERTGTLVVIGADGTGARELGSGVAPAWTPDSRTIIAARADNLFVIDVATGAAQPIPNTNNGFEPAVSPDGNQLAFARRNEGGSHDVWVVRLR